MNILYTFCFYADLCSLFWAQCHISVLFQDAGINMFFNSSTQSQVGKSEADCYVGAAVNGSEAWADAIYSVPCVINPN